MNTGGQAEAGRDRKEDGRGLAMLCHLGAFSGVVIPFGNFLVPLGIWLYNKEKYPLVDDQGKESLNFQLTLLLYGMGAFILTFVIVGIFLLAVLALFAMIQIIRASICASNGDRYRYWLNIRFIK